LSLVVHLKCYILLFIFTTNANSHQNKPFGITIKNTVAQISICNTLYSQLLLGCSYYCLGRPTWRWYI